jgi:hypothetical protein
MPSFLVGQVAGACSQPVERAALLGEQSRAKPGTVCIQYGKP